MAMEQITNAMLPSWIQWILLLFAAVGVIGAGFSYIGKLVQKATKPISDLTSNLNALASSLDDLAKRGEKRDQRVDAVEGAIEQTKEYQKHICLLALLIADHLIHGNGTEELRDAKKEMDEFLADK